MSRIAARKCVRHSAREAVARCAACEDHYCRECIVEHEGVLLCAPCLARQTAQAPAAGRGRWRRRATRLVMTTGSVVLVWLAFYGFGQFLKRIPAEVHEGTIWRVQQFGP